MWRYRSSLNVSYCGIHNPQCVVKVSLYTFTADASACLATSGSATREATRQHPT